MLFLALSKTLITSLLQGMLKLYESVGEKKVYTNATYINHTIGKNRVQSNEKPSKRAKKEKKIPYLKTRIAKRFDDGAIYHGTIVGFNGEYWKVKYDDDDEEEFDKDELKRYMKLYEDEKAKGE